MKFIALSLSLILAACANMPRQSDVKLCWEHHFEPNELSENTVVLCKVNNIASAKMFYSNTATTPTTCEASGVITKVSNEQMAIAFKRGSCGNGRAISAIEIVCRKLSEQTLECESNSLPKPLKLTAIEVNFD